MFFCNGSSETNPDQAIAVLSHGYMADRGSNKTPAQWKMKNADVSAESGIMGNGINK